MGLKALLFTFKTIVKYFCIKFERLKLYTVVITNFSQFQYCNNEKTLILPSMTFVQIGCQYIVAKLSYILLLVFSPCCISTKKCTYYHNIIRRILKVLKGHTFCRFHGHSKILSRQILILIYYWRVAFPGKETHIWCILPGDRVKVH